MNPSRFKSIFRILIAFIVVSSILVSPLGLTPALATESSGLPLGKLLNQDGTLNLTTGYNGKLDIDNYSVSLNPQHGPLFRPLSIAGNWSALGATPFNNTVDEIVVSGTDVYAGGNFQDAGGDANADYIARFNGTSWSALSTIPLNDTVEAIVVSGTDVYVGGSFTDAGGDANADFIAKFDGTSWSALGATPLTGAVTSIGIIGTDVYAGGSFTDAGGNANADRIAKFDGTNWSALGATPLNSSVRAIAVSGTDVYAGGLFTDAGGDANADYIARFDGTSWSALGATPLSNLVNTIAINGTDVYAGGNFLDAGGDTNGDRLAKFNGTSWSALGAMSFGSIVHAIAVSGTDVYVGGSFVNLGGNGNSNYIAKFNGTSWSPLGATPLSANVTAIAILSGTQVYAGGGFTAAGGNANADYIAKFTVSPAKAITAFNFASPAATGIVTEASHTINITVPYATNVTSLVPTIAHTGASISPNSGVAQDFTNPVIYTVTAADSSTQTYTVTVTVAANAPPVITEGASVSVTMSEDGSPTPFALTLNANDANGHTITWSILIPASHGTASASGTGTSKTISYTPQSNYNGSDSFTVRVSDGNSGFDTITVNVTIQSINDLPSITESDPVSVTMSEDSSPTPFALTLNASDIDSSTLITWSISTPASHGTASASGTGTSKAIGYTPLSDYNGPDSFDVQISDGNGGFDTITVNVTIQLINDLPSITESDPVSVTMSEDSSPTPFALTLNASDIDSSTLTWSISTPASHGTASASGTGTSKAIGYTPQSDYNGLDSFDVQVSDGILADTITVNVTIQPVGGDTPVISESDPVSITMSEDGSPTAFALTLNASDPDDDPLTWSISTPASHGTANASGIGTSKTIGYTPLPNYNGPDSFMVQVSDGGLTDTITVNVTIQPVSGDSPVIAESDPVSVTMSEDSSPTFFALTLNASDPDDDPLTWSIFSQGTHGTASASGIGTSKAIGYTPLPNYNGTDSFLVQVSDGSLTDTITVNVTIQPQPYDGPLMRNQSYLIQYDNWLGVRDTNAFGGAYRRAPVGNFIFKSNQAYTQFKWITLRGPNQGKAQIRVDGVVKATVDLYSPTVQWQYLVNVSGLTNQPHIVVIRALNQKNPASSGKFVSVDGFKIGAQNYDDNKIEVSEFYTYDSWVGLRNPSVRFGAYRASNTPGASMSFSFDGTKFTWTTARGPSYGKAAIYVDGILKKTVDLYNANPQWQYKVLIPGTTYGHHTVVIKVLGVKNARSSNFWVVSDGFEIQ